MEGFRGPARYPDAVSGTEKPPSIDVSVSPGGTHLGGPARRQVALLAAAPYALLAKINQVSSSATHGLTAQLRNGPVIYFGAAARLETKWNAAAAVLADPDSSGATYVDVTQPGRPAAGTGSDSSVTGGSPGSSAATSSSSAGPSSGPGASGAAEQGAAPIASGGQ